MSGSDLPQDERCLAASRIAADPAFSALHASGAPVMAAAGDPLRIVYVNDSARAIFGEDAESLGDRLFRGDEPGARRLAELVDSVRHGAALRLERLRFSLGAAPQTVTILCRKLAESDGPAFFVIAALGVRPAPPLEAPTPPVSARAPPPPSAAADAPTTALRAQLAARHGERAPRFLWKTDAEGRFIDVTHVLADVVGESAADVLGRSIGEVSRALDLDPAFEKAIASRKSWSGVEVAWPIDNPDARVPATLGALPIADEDRRFAGFQGYGVLHLARATLQNAPAPEAAAAAADALAPPPRHPIAAMDDGVDFSAANVVPLRPLPRTESVDAAPADDTGQDDAALTATERTAFEEIARALRDGGLVTAPTDVEPPPEKPGADAVAQMTALLDRLPVGVLVARGAQGLFANRTLLDYLGYTDLAAFEAEGGLARMFFGQAPQDVSAPPGSIAVQASDGEALDVDAHLQIVDWDGAPATLVTLRRNRARTRMRGPEQSALALARSLEEKLARARADNAALRAAFKASGEAMAFLAEDGRIVNANAAFAALFGADRATLVERGVDQLFSTDDVRALKARMARARADDAPDTLRLTVSKRGGGAAPMEVTLRRLADSAPKQFCLILRDLASSERSRDELEAARLSAEHASAAKSDFLARVSHEIRTPLNAIIGFAEVMMEERFGPVGSERYKEYLKDVHASGTHVLSLVNDLLDLSKIEAGKMELAFERVDANAVISECVSIMQTQANQARIVMRLALAPRLPRIRADERSLRQILLNLLSNAVKFNEPGGQVIVSSALTDAGFVVIRVKDTGVGMSDNEIETALEPFKQIVTSRKAPGTGLGLPVTKALIEANHASFIIKSRKNEGTLIEVAFPPPQVLAAE